MSFVEQVNARREEAMQTYTQASKEYEKASRVADFTSEVSDVALEHVATYGEVSPQIVAHEMIAVLEETISNLKKCYVW